MGSGSTETLWLQDDFGTVAGDLTITGDSTIPDPSYTMVRGRHNGDSMAVSYADPRHGFCRVDGSLEDDFARFDALRWCRVPDMLDTVTFVLQPGQPCTEDTYHRDDWGDYPPVDSAADPTWTQPHDSVNSPDITQDHHVALKDAHLSGGCNWPDSQKDAFSSDTLNLNPATRSFNSSKGNRTPDRLVGIARRIIDTADEKCRYARQHKAVKTRWRLTMTAAESDTVAVWLDGCT